MALKGMAGWDALGSADGRAPSSLASTRDTLHWAAQIGSAAGATLLPERPDSSHAALSWAPKHRALAGEPLPTLSASPGATTLSASPGATTLSASPGATTGVRAALEV